VVDASHPLLGNAKAWGTRKIRVYSYQVYSEEGADNVI
jgi:hypothetical protein